MAHMYVVAVTTPAKAFVLVVCCVKILGSPNLRKKNCASLDHISGFSRKWHLCECAVMQKALESYIVVGLFDVVKQSLVYKGWLFPFV